VSNFGISFVDVGQLGIEDRNTDPNFLNLAQPIPLTRRLRWQRLFDSLGF
jgi:hypothetical protein